MKKLFKLKLHNAVSLNDSQMKQIIGGYDDDSDYTGGYGKKPCKLPPKVCACLNHSDGDTCTWIDAAGNVLYGKCLAFAPDWTLHCSDAYGPIMH
ncbi:MAG: hypothetical protein GX416_04600 [Bacteroidales bacterium]|nr:hypothetical protein [Bacteroidales bacterium]